MKHSIDYVSNTILHANKKPAVGSSPTPRERRHARRDRVREEKTTPREQRHARRDKVREAENKLRNKDRIINQKHAKKREREVEVESIKEVKATPSPIQMAAIPLGSQQCIFGLLLLVRLIVPVGNLYVLLEIGAIAYYAVCFVAEICLKGRLIFGPDARSLYLTIGLIVVPIVVLIFLVAARDPGIIPRTQPSSDVDDDWDATSLSSDWA
nr:probable protein S-acyltransferase 7 [Tanacetum cinerariifolium]